MLSSLCTRTWLGLEGRRAFPAAETAAAATAAAATAAGFAADADVVARKVMGSRGVRDTAADDDDDVVEVVPLALALLELLAKSLPLLYTAPWPP